LRLRHNVNLFLKFSHIMRAFARMKLQICVSTCRRIVRGQTAASLETNKPDVCADRFEDWGKNESGCAVPVFAGNPPMVSFQSYFSNKWF